MLPTGWPRAITYFQAIVLGHPAGRHRAVPDLQPRPHGPVPDAVRLERAGGCPVPAGVLLAGVRRDAARRQRARAAVLLPPRMGRRSSRAFFRTLPKRRVETPTERLAWLIIVASIPAGILGLVFEHQLRTLTAKPEVAAFFLVVNGCVLFAAEWFRRRAEVRELAVREGAKPDGGRELETLEYREALVVGVAQSTALIAGHQPRRASRWAPGWHAAWTTAIRPGSRSCWPRRSSSPRACSSCPTCWGTSATACAARRSWRARGGGHGGLHGHVPGQILQDQNTDPVRDLLPPVRAFMVVYTQVS